MLFSQKKPVTEAIIRQGEPLTRAWSLTRINTYPNLRCAVWAFSMFWVGGERGIYRSKDGMKWDRYYGGENIVINDFSWNGTTLVAVGFKRIRPRGREAVNQPLVVRFFDGGPMLNRIAHSDSIYAAPSVFIKIIRGVDRYLATSENGELFSSYDANSFVKVFPRSMGDNPCLCWTGNHYVVSNKAGGFYYSEASIVSKWQQASVKSLKEEPCSIVWNGKELLAASPNWHFSRSPDGLAWTSYGLLRHGDNTVAKLNSLYWDDGVFYAITSKGFAESAEGYEWVHHDFEPDVLIKALAVGPEMMILVGNVGTIMSLPHPVKA